ncbi:DUF760 domain-containing protein [Gloeothece verrucosa]|uniref:DUF760 domain-containing protein n=1 Tax=Gloeothece verrucosa (strain PCC 7822) TaxID=497965 RepID=E0UE18_GLOV7|nr:DUF760 domain-containing protein [Gloeothece verrucosa]ADN13022.1 conserved hypothetical protein [Gloeothece verrucosa PCC 7822]
MNKPSNEISKFSGALADEGNRLWQYIQSLSPETIVQYSQPNSEVAQIMERDLAQMLGILPSEHFDVEITTSREDLGQLLASAMVKGYFLYNAQQRMLLEKSVDLGN